MAECLEQPPDWLGVLHSAAAHDVVGMVADGLRRSTPELVPDAIRRVFELHAGTRAREADRAWAELAAILSAFQTAGIPVIPFKGPVLAREIYADPACRSCRDLDFLVREADADRVVRLLCEQGYADSTLDTLTEKQFHAARRLFGEWSLFHADRLTVEPHWDLSPSTLAVDLDLDSVWRRAVRRTMDGVELLALSPEDRFLMVAIHGGKETWSHLKSLADVDRMLLVRQAIDWGAIERRARRAGILRIVRVALGLAHRCFGSPLPDSPATLVDFGRAERRLIDQLFGRLERMDLEVPPMNAVSALRFRMRERLGDRLAYTVRTLTTPRPEHFGIVRLPDRLIRLYVPVKLLSDYILLPARNLFKR